MIPRLFFKIVNLELRKQMSYRVDFWVNSIVSFFAAMGVMYFLWDSIFAASDQVKIGGYTLEEMILYYVLVILIAKLVRGSKQMIGIADDIYKGSLTKYQLFPTPYLVFKYAEHLGSLLPAIMQLFIFGIISPLIFTFPDSLNITPLTVFTCINVVMLANLLFFALSLPLQLVAFWADNVWSLIVMNHFISGLLGGAMLPLELFPDWGVSLLAYTPFAYLYHFPVRILTGHISTPQLWLGIGAMSGWILILCGCSWFIWKAGNKRYTGVGI
jgi:ABC-2 type transport system permease protein